MPAGLLRGMAYAPRLGSSCQTKNDVISWKRDYIAYHQTRFGVANEYGDDDDPQLTLPSQKLVRKRCFDVNSSLSQDVDPDENTSGAYILQETGRGRGADPSALAMTRTHAHFHRIDVERMPSSAINLRPREIRDTLLASLLDAAEIVAPKTEAQRQHLEDAALVTISPPFSMHPASTMMGDWSFIPVDVGSSMWAIFVSGPAHRDQTTDLHLACCQHILHQFHSSSPLSNRGKPCPVHRFFCPHAIVSTFPKSFRTLARLLSNAFSNS